MLGKLIKHDFISLSKKITIAWLIFALLVLLEIILSMVLQKSSVLMTSLASLSIVIFFGFSASGLFESLPWFSKKMFSKQGYLTHTLPAKTSSIIFSKIFTALLLACIGWALAIFSMYILSISVFKDSIDQVIKMLPGVYKSLAMDIFSDVAAKIIVSYILDTLAFITVAFFAICLAEFIKFGNKSFMSVLYFIVITIVFSLIFGKLIPSSSINSLADTQQISEIYSDILINKCITNGIEIATMLLGTIYICSNHLKLNNK